MNVRSMYRRGYLLYAMGDGSNKDGLKLFINPDGSLTAVCDNGDGPFSVNVKPSNSLCDGEFHQINLQKSGKTMILTVDTNRESVTTSGEQTSTDIGGVPIYIGGMPGTLTLSHVMIVIVALRPSYLFMAARNCTL